MSSTRIFARNASYLAGTNVVNLVVAFVFGKITSSFLGEAGFGRMILILSLTTFFEAMIRGSVVMVLTQRISQKKVPPSAYWWPNYLLLAIFSVIYFICVLIAWFAGSDRVLTIAFAFGAVLSLARLTGDGIIAFQRGWDQFDPEFRTTLLERFLFMLLMILMVTSIHSREVANTTGLIAIFAINAGTQTLQAILLVVPVWRKLRPSFTIDPTYVRDLVHSSRPLWVSVPLILLHGRVEIFFLQYFNQPVQLGHFGAASKLMDAERMVPWILCMALFPALTRQASRSAEGFGAAYITLMKVLIALAVPLSVLMIAFGPWIIRLAYTDEFLPASIAFMLMTAFMIPQFLNTLFGYGVVALEKQHLILKTYFGTLIVQIAAGYVLIPMYGTVGAAVTFVTSEIALLAISSHAIRREIHPINIRHFLRAILLVIVTGGVLVAGNFHAPFTGLILSLLVYAAFMWKIGIFTPEEIAGFKALRNPEEAPT